MEESRTAEDHMYVVEGMQFDRGYISPYFVTDPERMVHPLLSHWVQRLPRASMTVACWLQEDVDQLLSLSGHHCSNVFHCTAC